jgi:parallel beta-helix repeat protein
MSRKLVYSIVTVVVLMGVLGVSFNVNKVEAQLGTIYIMADGSIDPPTANITSTDNVTYTFTDNINASIVVQRSNIIIDGDGWTLDGLDFTIWEGLNLTDVSNVTIIDINIERFASYSIYLKSASQCVISDNTVTGSEGGIGLFYSTGIEVSDNEITGCWEAVEIIHSSGNVVSGNNITDNVNLAVTLFNSTGNTVTGNRMTANNFAGVSFRSSSNFNTISGNNITNNRRGITLLSSSNSNTISGNNITDNEYHGISIVDYSHNNTISRNILVNNTNGIDIVGVLFTTISRNHITENNQYGITLDNASNNTISENNITNNSLGIYYDGLCNNNTAYHNNFIDNTKQVEVSPGDVDAWDDGVEGNYWSNYTGVDLNHDGVGDSWHEIGANNIDHFPLMGPFHSFNTTLGKHINVISNSTIESFQHFESNSTIIIHVSNVTANQTRGFCRISIPYEVMSEPFNVTIDGANPTYWNYTLYDNGTHRWIYFEYEHTTREIVIIPEFPSFLIPPLFMVATLLAVIAHRKKHPKMIARKKKRGVGLNPSRSL